MSVSRNIYRKRRRDRTDEEKRELRLIYKAQYRLRNAGKIKTSSSRYRAENKELIAERKAAAYFANPEPAKRRAREHRAANYVPKPRKAAAPMEQRIARRKESNKIWCAANRERLNKRKREWEKAHPEQARLRARNLWKNNPEKVRQKIAARRARKINATVGNPKAITRWDRAWRNKKMARCFWCNGKFPTRKCQADHIHALTKGGAHSIENLCISCADCNRKKNAQSVEVWNKKIEQPILL